MGSAILENASYKVPIYELSLHRSSIFNRLAKDITLPSDYPVEPLALKRGFRQFSSIKPEEKEWLVYERPNYLIPNFPGGATTTHSMLAILSEKKQSIFDGSRYIITYPILRYAAKPFSKEQFIKDLTTLSHHYIERAPTITDKILDTKLSFIY